MEHHSQYCDRQHYTLFFRVPYLIAPILPNHANSQISDALKNTKKGAQKPVLSFLNNEMAEGQAKKTPIDGAYWYFV